MIDVSVIVLTYNLDYEKLRKTIYSIAVQERLQFELIICDDATPELNEDIIYSYLNRFEWIRYKMIKHASNQGTVLNIYDGLLEAKGKYVFLISPGDFLYNNLTLWKMFSFAEGKGYKFVCGREVSYSADDGNIVFYNYIHPKLPMLLRENTPFNLKILSFLAVNNPVGSTYLRDRELFIKYIELIKGRIIYMEDEPTSLLYLMDRYELGFIDDYVIWYEFGHGITTKSSKPNIKIIRDLEQEAKLMLEKFNEYRVIKAFYLLPKKAFYLLPRRQRLIYFDIRLGINFIRICSQIYNTAHKLDSPNVKELKKILLN